MILNNFEPPFGGPELQVAAITSRLRERGHEVIIIARGTNTAPQYEEIHGLPVYRLQRKGCGSVDCWRQLSIMRDRFDVIHVHGVGRLASAAILFARLHGKKVFVKVTTAGHIIKELPPGAKGMLKALLPFRWLKPALLKQAHGIIAISDEILAELEKTGFSGKKISYIPNGVDLEKYRPATDEEKLELRKQLGLPPEKKVYIFTGKITSRKGIDTLLQAWQGAAALRGRAVLVLVGSGAGQSDNAEEWACRFVTEQNLGDAVVFAGARTNIPEYLAAADCFVFPSRREGLPNSLLEAMAANLLCLASDIGGNRDVIMHGETGMLVPAERVADWSEALENALLQNDPALGAQARELIKSKFSLDATVEKLIELYESE